MGFRLCLFDLDDTLLRTGDLEVRFRGLESVGDTSQKFAHELRVAFASRADRFIYAPEHLSALKVQFRDTKFGVFTRAPRHYALTLLAAAYPSFKWDTIVAFEDVASTKPHPDGIWKAMKDIRLTGARSVQDVVVVGDDKRDVQAAYSAGCWAILDQSSWTKPWEGNRYRALERVPDAVISSPDQLRSVLGDPWESVPLLELLVSGAESSRTGVRIDGINHFFPDRKGHVRINTMGRLFSNFQEFDFRRAWHPLTAQIHAHKDADSFPKEWIRAIRAFIVRNYLHCLVGGVVVTVIPFKPGRKPRLEALLGEVARSHSLDPMTAPSGNRKLEIEFAPMALAFGSAAKSSHGKHLSREERFANIQESLVVKEAASIAKRTVIVIDDVTTSGASLLWAHNRLFEAGARKVICLSLTKAVGVQ